LPVAHHRPYRFGVDLSSTDFGIDGVGYASDEISPTRRRLAA